MTMKGNRITRDEFEAAITLRCLHPITRGTAYYTRQDGGRHPRVYTYYYFTQPGIEVGHYIVDLQQSKLWAEPRQWDMATYRQLRDFSTVEVSPEWRELNNG